MKVVMRNAMNKSDRGALLSEALIAGSGPALVLCSEINFESPRVLPNQD